MFPVTVAVNCWDWLVATTAARFGDTLTVTLGAATVRLMFAVCDNVPEAPVAIRVAFPCGAAPVAVSAKVAVVDVLRGLKDAVTPLGSPETDRLTLPLKPFCPITVIALVMVPPWPMFGLEGDAERVKLGGGGGVTLPPPHPARLKAAITAIHTLRGPALLSMRHTSLTTFNEEYERLGTRRHG